MQPAISSNIPSNQSASPGPPAPASETVADAGSFDSGFYVPIDDQRLFSLDGVRGVANGNVAITLGDREFAGALTPDREVESFRAGVSLRGALTLELRFEAAGEVSGRIALPMFVLPALMFGNVVVTPYVSPRMKYSGTVAASGRVSFVVPFSASIQFIARGQPDVAMTALEPEVGAPDAALDAHLNVEVQVSLAFMVTINGIPVGGPALTLSLGVDVHVTVLPAPVWYADLLTELSGGWTLTPDSPVTDTRVVDSRQRLGEGNLPVASPSSRWARVYDLNGDSATSCGLLADGEGAILMGNSNLGAWPWLAGVERSGSIVWQHSAVPRPFGAMNVRSLIRASNGDLVATGDGMRVQRYDRTGRPLWARSMEVGPSTLTKWKGSAATPSGGAILVGHIGYVATGQHHCVLLELGADGAMRWMTALDFGATLEAPTLNAVALTPEGEILAVGAAGYQDGQVREQARLIGANGLVVRVRGDGSLRSAFAVGTRQSDELRAIAMFSDGQYAVAGLSAPSRGSGGNGAWIARFDSHDAVRWSYTYAAENAAGYAHVSALATWRGQGLVAVGGSGTPEQTRHAWLFRTDREGMPVFFKTLDGAQDDTLTHIVEREDGVLAFGYTRSFDATRPVRKNDLWAVRTSVDGTPKLPAGSGVRVQNVAARWQRAAIDVRALMPAVVPSTLTLSNPPFEVAPAQATDTLVT